MKGWLSVAVALLLGTAGGLGAAMLEVGRPVSQETLTEVLLNPADSRMPSLPPPGGPRPKATIDQEEYDFGTMDSDEEGTHEFVVTNTGEGELVLTKGDTTCRCAVAELGGSEEEHEVKIGPHKSGKITLSWTLKDFVGPFRQSATIFTNDPGRRRLELSVRGEVTTSLRISPQELVLNRVSANQPTVGRVRMYCYRDEPLEILSHEWTEPGTADQFDVEFEPLATEELEEDELARSGYVARVTVKPGLPLGLFQQTMQIKTNVDAAETVDVPIRGTVASDISVVGRDWNSEKGVLTIGTVNGREGAERSLLLVVRGPHRKEVRFRPSRIAPDLLEVEVGQPTEINEGVVIQTPLTIRLPKGSPPANYLGSKQGELGEILLDTNHPDAPQLRILVRFAVAG
jgi:hypothetical protein